REIERAVERGAALVRARREGRLEERDARDELGRLARRGRREVADGRVAVVLRGGDLGAADARPQHAERSPLVLVEARGVAEALAERDLALAERDPELPLGDRGAREEEAGRALERRVGARGRVGARALERARRGGEVAARHAELGRAERDARGRLPVARGAVHVARLLEAVDGGLGVARREERGGRDLERARRRGVVAL